MEPFNDIPDVFDCFCMIGKGTCPVAEDLYGLTPETLLAEMDQKGVAEALVHHSLSRLVHPIDGNAQLLKALAGHPRLHPCFGLLSKGSREYEDSDGYVAEAVAQGVRCFAVFPRYGAYPLGYDLSLWEFVRSGTFEPLEARRLPLVVDFVPPQFGTDCTDWEALRFLLRAHPDLPVILTEQRMRVGSRPLFSVMDDHPNLHVEVAGQWNYKAVELLAKEWGAERVLFGTRAPQLEVGMALGNVSIADLSAEARALILSGNIRRLTGLEVQTQ